MVSKETINEIEGLIKEYLPTWFRDEFHERIHRFEIKDDVDLIQEFLKLIYLHFIQPVQFIKEALKNLHEIHRDVKIGRIELIEGSILIKQDVFTLFGKEISYDEIENIISDFDKLRVELGLGSKDFTKFGKW